MSQSKLFDIRHKFESLGYSLAGLAIATKEEVSFQQELLLSALLIPLALFAFDITGVEKALLVGSIFLILITELLNTAVEATIDRISDEKHPLSKKAKDTGSAAVLLALLNALIIWCLILLAR
ncbi:MAG: diacylglycerol kinase [Rickettsiales bacterium]|nr:diacylglycerol kinase [Rickettsiales bacterium]